MLNGSPKMPFQITNGEILDFILTNGDLQRKDVSKSLKFRNVALKFIKEHRITNQLGSVQLILKHIHDVKEKTEHWRGSVRVFETEDCEPESKRGRKPNGNDARSSFPGRPALTLSENPCYKVESAILKDSLGYVTSAAEQQCVPKEDMLNKMVQEAIRARDWDMSSFIENLVVSPISFQEVTALFHVANLSQRQYQMCRNLLVKYGINGFPPQNDIDSFKKTLYPTVRVEPLSASVNVKELFDSTLFDIIDNELLCQSIVEMPIDACINFQVKAGLDGSGSHKKRQQLSGDEDDDGMTGNSDSFVGVFMTPMLISVENGDENVIFGKIHHQTQHFAQGLFIFIKLKSQEALLRIYFQAYRLLLIPLQDLTISKGYRTKQKLPQR